MYLCLFLEARILQEVESVCLPQDDLSAHELISILKPRQVHASMGSLYISMHAGL